MSYTGAATNLDIQDYLLHIQNAVYLISEALLLDNFKSIKSS